MKYVLVKTDCSVEIVEISTKEFLKKAHELINCSLIEIATPNYGRSPFRIVLDDEGKFNGQKFNKLATIFYQKAKKTNFAQIFGQMLEDASPDVVDEFGRTMNTMNHIVK